MAGRVLSKVGGRAILLMLNILDSARIRLYMLVASLSRGIGQERGWARAYWKNIRLFERLLFKG